MNTLLRVATLALALTATAPSALAQPASGTDAVFRATTLSLTAHGEVKIAPDMATIILGVTTEAATAIQAAQANAERMARVTASLKRMGLAERDVRTSQLSLTPQYAYPQNQPPQLTGYRAANQATLTVRDLKRLGSILDAAVGAGATDLGGISFGLQDPSAAEDAARLAASRALQAKAEVYAKANGLRILRLVNLSEGASYVPPPGPIPLAQAAARDVAVTPVSPGEIEVRVDVSGTYELGG